MIEFRTLLSHARKQTAAGILGWIGGVSGLVISSGVGIGGSLVGGMLSPDHGGAIGGAAGFAFSIAALFSLHLLRAEVSIWRQRAETAEAALASARQSTTSAAEFPAPERDWRIGELFRHIRPDVLGRENGREIWLTVGEQIRQAIEDSKLRVWGRRCGENGLQLDTWQEKPPLVLLDRSLWHTATFSYRFFAADTDGEVHLYVQDLIGRSCYCDLRVNSVEAQRAFPTNNPSPDSGKWQSGWFVYNEPKPLTHGQYSFGATDIDHRVMVTEIPPGARIRYSVDTEPKVSSWRIGLAGDRAEFNAQMNPANNHVTKIGSDGHVGFFADPTTAPATLYVRVQILSWTRADD